jgi:hypothetical protein
MVILDVRLEVLRQIGDTRSQERNLDLGRTSVALRPLVVLHQLGFLRNVYGHHYYSSRKSGYFTL